MDTKGLQKEFISWCKANKKSPKSEDETKLLFHKFMQEKHPAEYKAAMEKQKQASQQQAQKAAHGAKLNYFKSLKNQCAEDEEVIYYKKGGSVTCGCKKKEDGGQVNKAKEGSVIEKFKARKMQDAGKLPPYKKTAPDKNGEYRDNRGNFVLTKKGIAEREAQLKNNKNEEGKADPKKLKVTPTKPIKKEDKVKKGCSGVKAFKMHRLGGKITFSI